MRHVDHDPVASRRAARSCRDRAHDYERIAAEVGQAVAAVAWWGAERDRVAGEVADLCADLRREAASLRTSATVLEAAARAAEQREADVAEQLQRAADAASAAAQQASIDALLDPGPPWLAPPPPPSPTVVHHVPSGVL